MAVAALTPRVRNIIICDDAVAGLTEDAVFTLEGVRFHLVASSFPCRRDLNVFLFLSSARKGRYPGRVLVVNEQNAKVIRYVKFFATFDEDNGLLVLNVDVGDCVFPEPGRYNFQIYFVAAGGGEALKGEHPLIVLSEEE